MRGLKYILKDNLIQSVAIICSIMMTLGLVEIVIESRLDSSNDSVLAMINESAPKNIALKELEAQAWQRVRTYEKLISESHLEDGMLVQRTIEGIAIDHCDSLLFSSLRYVALSKLAFTEKAQKAWAAISASREIDGSWRRHPKCSTPTSRDMILGLMVSLTQKPPNNRKIIQDLTNQIHHNDGFFSTGPPYVSYLTPGMGNHLYRLIQLKNLHIKKLPTMVKYGFSTSEFDSLTSTRGYQSHLIALSIWIELELGSQYPDRAMIILIRFEFSGQACIS